MKVGIVTLYNYNYGSALQCYATQEYLRDYDCESILIEKERGSRIHSYASTLSNLLFKCATNPTSAKQIISQFRAQRFGSLKMSRRSLEEIERFVQNYIDKKTYNYSELKKIAHTEEYEYFLTGSDQVWNGARILGYDMFFLRFAPAQKRVAWAPSFGGTEIAEYNERDYSRYIADFQAISVREKSGAQIIRQFTNKECDVLCDPVVLFTGEQWRDMYRNKTKIGIEGPYICLFFIDNISNQAIRFARDVSEKHSLKTVSFGYYYESYKTIIGHTHFDGSPFDFLKCIDEAEIVITDSFHATIFSSLFHTEVYAFTRNYEHSQNQSTRLTDLLEKIDADERFDSFEEKQPIDFSYADRFFMRERVKADCYITHVLGCKQKEEKDKIVLFEYTVDCCGCGACADICPKKAISMSLSNKGYYPIIDNSICVKCGRCLDVCGQKKIDTYNREATESYIGKGSDKEFVKKSASGGVFSTIAYSFLKSGGVVYGASLSIEDGKCDCKHIRVDNTIDLGLILNSKYVQSRTDGVFNCVKQDLKQGKRVLFSGTSCQVASLKAFIGNEHDNLFTIDLICHGVPPIELLQDYVDFIQKTEQSKVMGVSFRCKDNTISQFAPYIMTFDLESKKGFTKKHIALRNSSFYRLFMSMVGYRDSCYNCKYATVNKPADVTLGDYYVAHSKSPSIESLELDLSDYYSCVICRSKKGESLLSSANLELHTIPLDEVELDHEQLQRASLPTKAGIQLYEIYKKKGFGGLQRYINIKNSIIDIARKIKVSN